jgi:hypothetical protein
MQEQPSCPLCRGDLVREQGVDIKVSGPGMLSYELAWVCERCSAAFPIAIGKGGIIRKARSLYEDGSRTK